MGHLGKLLFMVPYNALLNRFFDYFIKDSAPLIPAPPEQLLL